MTIGIEAERANNPQKTGVEHYAQQLILQFAKLDQENEYILYLRTTPEKWITELPKNFRYKVLPFPKFWTQLRLSVELLLHPVDRLFVPASAIPLWSPKKSICTIHDAAFLFYPETFTWFNRNFLHWSYKYIAWKASTIIAVSEATKKDLVTYYKIAPDKIQVIYHGYTPVHQDSSSTSEASPKTETLDIRNRLPEKYVLFLSTLQPRKNLERLIEAFRALKNKRPELPHKLVIVGRRGWKTEKIVQAIERNNDIVVYLDYVTDLERSIVYQKASLMAMPSLYEGFGMWILEAFDASLPQITSNISSMPEVGGNACEYCDPKDVASITQALERVLCDPLRSEQLVTLGHAQLAQFSWERCARQTLEAIKAK